MPALTLEMLPAREGDCLLLSYRDERRTRRILVDGGRAATWPQAKRRLAEIPEPERVLELLVITHVDRDHIEGVLKMLEDPECPVSFRDIWFNGYAHTKAVSDEEFGAVQGDALTRLLSDLPWNRRFGERSVRLPEQALGPAIELEGGLELTVLSPSAKTLAALRGDWEKECRAAGLVPSEELPPPMDDEEEEQFGALNVESLCAERFNEDTARANGSSIALLVEFRGRRVLLGADAHPSVLVDAIERLQPGGGQLALDAFKLPHHGSSKNVSRELLERVNCRRYLVSTNGSQFKHPSAQAIARVLKHGGEQKELIFNYRTQYNEVWDESSLQERYGYTTTFGEDGHVEIAID